MAKFVLVPIEHYLQLETDSNTLNALESGGVDNWDNYSEAISDWEDEYGETEFDESNIKFEIVEKN